MTPIAVAGWALCALLAAALLVCRRRGQIRLARIAEAEHELRGPLTALGFAIDALGPDGWAGGDALRAELARTRCALADLAGARTGRPSPALIPTAIDLGRVVGSSVAAWRPAAVAAGVELCAAAPAAVPVLGDPGRIAQATGNLIANAIEHGSGPVQVRVVSSGRCARVEIADAGPGPAGIPRSLSASSRVRPRGHGLRVAARVAAQHGGALSVSPAHPRERGVVVALTFPLPPAD